MCYLWGCGLSIWRTPGAVQAQSSGSGGRRAGAARPRPAPPRWQALQATHCLGGRATGLGGGGRRDARRAPCPARPGPPPPGPARHARPAPPRWQGRCPSAQGPAAAGGQGREGGGGPRGRGQGEALRLAGCAAGHPPRGWPWPGPHLFVEQRN